MLELEQDIRELKENIDIKKKRKVIAIIPARRNSKRIEGKNWKLFAGKPLICWTIEEALKCDFLEEIVISTDSPEIIEIVNQRYTCEPKILLHERPRGLAQDHTIMEEVLFYIVKDRMYELDTILILLQPTSPLRTMYHISHAYQIFKERVSCTLIPGFREDALHFKLNGAIFIFTVAHLLLTKKVISGEFLCMYLMNEKDSVDIDTLNDFIYAENLMLKRLNNGKEL